MNLINNIKTIKHNSDYRVSDVVCKLGERWEHSGNMILTSEKYNGTILQRYLEKNGLYTSTNLDILLNII